MCRIDNKLGNYPIFNAAAKWVSIPIYWNTILKHKKYDRNKGG